MDVIAAKAGTCQAMLGRPVGSYEAGFPYAFLWANGALEAPCRRWLPFGMPRFHRGFTACAFFLFRRDMQKSQEIMQGPFGTGVIIEVPKSRAGVNVRHFYAVTAHHVLGKESAYSIRLDRHGETRWLHIDPHEWIWDTGGPDIAAADITEELIQSGALAGCVGMDAFCTKEFIAHQEVGVGEDGFMLGLFHDLPGAKRNLVVGRFGNVALMATDSAKVKLPNGKSFPAHLFDIRSRPGFSGSPVFVYRVPTNDLRDGGAPGFNIDANNKFLKLLGIHVSQYNDFIPEIEIRQSPGQAPQYIKTGKELVIPNSVTIVVPAWEVGSLLMQQRFKDQREAREMDEESKRLSERTAAPEGAPAASSESAPPTTYDGR